jgi:hypothetical protein
MPNTTTTGEAAAAALSGTELIRGVQTAANVKITATQISTLANSSTRSVATGGTGSTTASAARTALGVAIGTDVQAYSANLATHAGKTADTDGTLAANSDVRYPTQKAVKTYVDAQVVSAAGDVVGPASSTDGLPAVYNGATGKILKAATASSIRTSIGVAIGSDVQAYDADLAAIAGLTATTDNFIQSKSSAWASRTVAQVSVDLQGTGLVSDAVGFRTIPQNSKSAGYTAVAADAAKHIYHPSADTTARTWVIDSNANVSYPIGTAITFINDTSGGVITISITSDTLVLAGPGTTGSRTLAANGIATAIKMTSTRWMISGTGLT